MNSILLSVRCSPTNGLALYARFHSGHARVEEVAVSAERHDADAHTSSRNGVVGCFLGVPSSLKRALPDFLPTMLASTL